MEQEGSIVNLILEHLSEIMISSFFLLLSLSMIFFMYNPQEKQQELIAQEIYDSLKIITPGTSLEIEIKFQAEVSVKQGGFEVKIGNNEPTFKKFDMQGIEITKRENKLNIIYEN